MSDDTGKAYPLSPASIAQEMLDAGLTYGSEYSNEYFEQRTLVSINDPIFGLKVSAIGNQLIESGFYLSSRGMSGSGYRVVSARENRDVVLWKIAKSIRELSKASILGHSTDTSALTGEERRNHDHATLRAGHLAQVIRREARRKLPALAPKPPELPAD